MGDYADAILKNDKRFDIEGLADWVKKGNILRTQEEFLTELFRPIKDKILCLLTGNHEETIHLAHQEDFTHNLCKNLGVRYGGYQCFIPMTFERGNSDNGAVSTRNYVVHAWHGSGAAQSHGGRLMRLMKLVNDISANIYLMGHLHATCIYAPARLYCRAGKIKDEPLVAAMTGSWLTTYTQSTEKKPITPSYGEVKGYQPSVLGCPVVHIEPDENKITVET